MDKLQELTDKLYNEGLSRGKQEGEALLEEARARAEAIIQEARDEAGHIIERARKDAEDYRTKVEGDLRMASAQTLQATRKDIENLIVGKISDEKVDKALSSEDFIKGIIKAVAEKFNAEEATDLDLVLPASLQDSLLPFVSGELSKALKGEVKASFSKKIQGGFTIGPKDGGYFVSLTDDTFKSLISEYLRPVTRKLLFGK